MDIRLPRETHIPSEAVVELLLDQEWLSPSEAALALVCSVDTIYRWIHDGTLKRWRQPAWHKRIQIHVSSVRAAMEEGRRHPRRSPRR